MFSVQDQWLGLNFFAEKQQFSGQKPEEFFKPCCVTDIYIFCWFFFWVYVTHTILIVLRPEWGSKKTVFDNCKAILFSQQIVFFTFSHQPPPDMLLLCSPHPFIIIIYDILLPWNELKNWGESCQTCALPLHFRIFQTWLISMALSQGIHSLISSIIMLSFNDETYC